MMLLANSQQGALEAVALQEHVFCCALLPAELATTHNKKEIVRRPQAPAALAGE
jgi:hypothetical protein